MRMMRVLHMNSPAFSAEKKELPMTRFVKYLAAAGAVVGLTAPALAQYVPQTYPQQTYPPQGYPQQYPQQYPPQGYPQQYPQSGYGYPGQGYGTNNPIQGVIDQLLGNRYNVNDRTAVQYCAAAAVADATARYRPNYNQGYGQQPYGQGYQQPYGGQNAQGYGNAYGYSARVTSVTNVERRDNGLRVSGTLDSGRYGGYGNQGYNRQGYNTQGYNTPGYGNPGYGTRGYVGAYGDLTFRCNVDYRGAVTNLRVRPNTAFRRPY